MADKDIVKVTLPTDLEGALELGATYDLPMSAVVLPDGYLSPKEVKEGHVPKNNVEKLIESRLTTQAENLRKELQEDPAFTREVLIQRGVPINEEGEIDFPKAGVSAEEMQAKLRDQLELAKAQWIQKELDPVRSKLSASEQRTERLRRRILHSEILEAGRQLGVRPEKFEVLPGAPVSSAPIIAQLENRFGYDDEHDQWAIKTGESSFQLSTRDDPERPYAGPMELLEALKEDKGVREKWYIDERPGGTDIGRPKGSGERDPEKQSDSERAATLRQMRTSVPGRNVVSTN